MIIELKMSNSNEISWKFSWIYLPTVTVSWLILSKSWPLKDPLSWIWLDGFVGLLFEMQKQTGRDENQTEKDSHARSFQINPLKRNNPHFLEVRESTRPHLILTTANYDVENYDISLLLLLTM